MKVVECEAIFNSRRCLAEVLKNVAEVSGILAEQSEKMAEVPHFLAEQPNTLKGTKNKNLF